MTSGAVTPFIRAAALTTASASRKRPWEANQRGDSGTNLVSRHATQTCWKQNSFLRLSVIWVAVEKALEVVRKWHSHLVMNYSDIPISHVANRTTVQYRPGKGSILVYYELSLHGSYEAPLCPNIIDYSAELHCCHKKSASSVNKNQESVRICWHLHWTVWGLENVPLFHRRNFFLSFQLDFRKPRHISNEITWGKKLSLNPKKASSGRVSDSLEFLSGRARTLVGGTGWWGSVHPPCERLYLLTRRFRLFWKDRADKRW